MVPSWQDQLDELLVRVSELRAAGDRPGAVRLLDCAPELVQAFGAWKFTRGSLAFEAGDLTRAVKELEAAVQREPKMPEFRANLGAALLEKGRGGDHFALRRARQLFEAACKDTPRLPEAHASLGAARLALDDAEGALGCFDRALALDPRHLPSLYQRGAALKKLGRPKDALAMVEKLLKLDPRFQPALEARDGLLAQLKG